MKRIFYCLFLFVALTQLLYGQGGTWVWVKGSSTPNPSIIFPTQSISDTAAKPPPLYGAANWIDMDGNFWIFGGYAHNLYSDLWKYNPVTNIWTWVKGPGIANQNGIYGLRGVPSDSAMPGARYKSTSWTDGNGALWLFGGEPPGFDTNLNDLWKYNIATNQWTWMNGSSATTANGDVNGIYQHPSPVTTPGGRYGSSGWIDDNNNLWLFGGAMAYSFDFPSLTYNDVWKYNIETNEWAWMNGPTGLAVNYGYGKLGVENSTNIPFGREGAASWQDTLGNFYLFGGGQMVFQELSPQLYNDVWKYNPQHNAWTWIAGDSLWDPSGSYSGYCNENLNAKPAAHAYSGTGKALCRSNNCFLFGGARFDATSPGDVWNLNDLWFFNMANNNWNWVNGNTVRNDTGSYGNIGVVNSGNLPSARSGQCQWTDKNGVFWIFGGDRYNLQADYLLNDVWKFIPDTSCTPIKINEGIYSQIPTKSIYKGDTILLNLTGTIAAQVAPNTSATKMDSVHWLLYPDSTTLYTITGQSYCGINSTQSFTLTVYTRPKVYVMASDTNFCLGDSVILSVPYGFVSYNWNNGGTEPYIYAKQNGSYYVTVTENATCSAISDTLGINLYQTNPVEVIQSADTLIASGEIAYEWFRNNTLIAAFSRNLHKYIASTAGTYTVLAIDSNGCRVNSLPVVISGIHEAEDNRISIYPNPANELLQIELQNITSTSIQISVMDISGQLIKKQEINATGKIELDVSALSAGIYFLVVQNEAESVVRKFVKQ